MQGFQGFRPSSAALPAHWHRAETEVEQPGQEPADICDAGTTGRKLACYTTRTGPMYVVLKANLSEVMGDKRSKEHGFLEGSLIPNISTFPLATGLTLTSCFHFLGVVICKMGTGTSAS